MKNEGLIEDKIENILKKRYALEKIISFCKFLGVFALTLLSYTVFFLFWVWVAKSKKLNNVEDIKYLLIYVGVLIGTLGIGVWIWNLIGKYIPKFALIGLLGWFLIGGGLVSSLVVPAGLNGPDGDGNDKDHTSIQLPATRFTGVNEKSTADVSLSSPLDINALNQFLAPALKNNTENRTIIQETEFDSLRLLVLFLLLLVLFNLYFTVTMFDRTGKSRWYLANLCWNKRESAVKINIGIIALLSIGLFLLTLNYLFLLSSLLALSNIFLIRWEILQRGQNHKILTRSVLFLFLLQFFSMVSGEIFFLIYLPVFIYIKKGSQVLSLHDVFMLNWIVLVGSLASALIGITTEVVWSGRRLTEKLN